LKYIFDVFYLTSRASKM